MSFGYISLAKPIRLFSRFITEAAITNISYLPLKNYEAFEYVPVAVFGLSGSLNYCEDYK